MYVAPNTNVRILKNVPLDNTYRNTIYFSTASAQTAYFSTLTKYNNPALTYVNMNEPIMVGINAEILYEIGRAHV